MANKSWGKTNSAKKKKKIYIHYPMLSNIYTCIKSKCSNSLFIYQKQFLVTDTLFRVITASCYTSEKAFVTFWQLYKLLAWSKIAATILGYFFNLGIKINILFQNIISFRCRRVTGSLAQVVVALNWLWHQRGGRPSVCSLRWTNYSKNSFSFAIIVVSSNNNFVINL